MCIIHILRAAKDETKQNFKSFIRMVFIWFVVCFDYIACVLIIFVDFVFPFRLLIREWVSTCWRTIETSNRVGFCTAQIIFVVFAAHRLPFFEISLLFNMVTVVDDIINKLNHFTFLIYSNTQIHSQLSVHNEDKWIMRSVCVTLFSASLSIYFFRFVKKNVIHWAFNLKFRIQYRKSHALQFRTLLAFSMDSAPRKAKERLRLW